MTQEQQVKLATSAQVKAILDLCATKKYQTTEDFTTLTSVQASEKIQELIAFITPSDKQIARLKEQQNYIVKAGYMSETERYSDAEISRLSGGMTGEMSKTIQAFEEFLKEHPECLPVSDKQIDYLTDIHTCLDIESPVLRKTPEGRFLTRAEVKAQMEHHFNLKTAKEFIENNSETYTEFRRTATPMQTIEQFRRAEKLAKGEDLAKASTDRLRAVLSRGTVATEPTKPAEETSEYTDIELLNLPVTEVWELIRALSTPKSVEEVKEEVVTETQEQPVEEQPKPRRGRPSSK